MSLIHLFLKDESQNMLLESTLAVENCPRRSYLVDPVAVPIRFEFKAESDHYEIQSWCRDNSNANMMQYGQPMQMQYDASVTVSADTPAQIIFLAITRKAEQFLQASNFWESNTIPDSEEGGIMIFVENGKLAAKVVKGKDRPDMQCFTATGLLRGQSEIVTARPYKEDIVNAIRSKWK